MSSYKTVLILSVFYVTYTNAFDISVDSLFSKKVLKCYTCSSLKNDECKNSTKVMLEPKFLQECSSGAKGCVKQWVQRYDGKNATFRECYYGSISSIYTNFDCDAGIERSRRYDKVKCFKCKGDLCNKSNRLQSSTRILCYTLFVMAVSFMLKM